MLNGGTDDTNSRLWWDVADNWEGVLSEEECKPQVVIPADWQVWKTGTMQYGFYYYSGSPLYEPHATTIYQDVNHPGVYKIEPYADASLVIELDSKDNSFRYAVQVVGTDTAGDITAGDWDADQGTDHSDDPSYRGYFDSDEGGWLFMTIWRINGKLAAYGFDAFFEDE